MARTQHVIVNEVLSADGNSRVLTWDGGLGTMAAYGTFGTGTAKLQVSYDDGTTYIDAGADTTLTVDGHGNFDLPASVLLRVNLAGGASPSITVEIRARGGTA